MGDRYSLFGEDNVILVNSHAKSQNPLKDFSGWLPDDVSEDDFTTINEEFRGHGLRRTAAKTAISLPPGPADANAEKIMSDHTHRYLPALPLRYQDQRRMFSGTHE